MRVVKELHVNGSRHAIDADADRSLLSVLREDLGLTGTKYGCGEGQCGACTVLLDGRPTRACVTKAAAAASAAITTIEGLEQEGRLHPVQKAFLDQDAMQCGYCTPGMILEAVALLRRQPDPSEAEIGRALDRHLCRCCTYARIVRAVRAAASGAKQP